ncbi:MAG: hypothetical protein EXR63_02385 [Dehalococcoidia bacterium]|nr:hypothetical protein [Dehalococcoidia bacterium]
MRAWKVTASTAALLLAILGAAASWFGATERVSAMFMITFHVCCAATPFAFAAAPFVRSVRWTSTLVGIGFGALPLWFLLIWASAAGSAYTN